MVDSLRWSLDKALTCRVHERLGLPDVGYGLVTLHRPALVDDPDRLAAMLCTLGEVATILPVVFPVHPRTRAMIDRAGLAVDERRLHLVPPQGYLDFVALEAMASVVVTDSGGIQEETSVLGVPCVTVRENTERPVTITRGTNSLVGFDRDRILAAVVAAIRERGRCSTIPGWDGSASMRIVEALTEPMGPSQFVPPVIQVAPLPEHRVARLTTPGGVSTGRVGVGG
jgi:UDP-N-acetylglucosamine 2-epimerase (non-hydrolysing)